MPVAQLDRALACGAKGRRFESSQARHFLKWDPRKFLIFGEEEKFRIVEAIKSCVNIKSISTWRGARVVE